MQRKEKGDAIAKSRLTEGNDSIAMRKKYWNEMTQKQIKTIPARQRKNAATWIGRFFSLRIKVL